MLNPITIIYDYKIIYLYLCIFIYVVVQLLSYVWLFGRRGLQHVRLLCPLLSPRVCSNSYPLSWWCYLTISSSAAPFSFCLQSFPVAGSVCVCVCVCVLTHIWLFVSPWTIIHQAPLTMGFPRQESWRGLPFPPSRIYLFQSLLPLNCVSEDKHFPRTRGWHSIFVEWMSKLFFPGSPLLVPVSCCIVLLTLAIHLLSLHSLLYFHLCSSLIRMASLNKPNSFHYAFVD